MPTGLCFDNTGSPLTNHHRPCSVACHLQLQKVTVIISYATFGSRQKTTTLRQFQDGMKYGFLGKHELVLSLEPQGRLS